MSSKHPFTRAWGRAALGVIAAAAVLAPGCSGNINDGSVLIAVTTRASVSSSGAQSNQFSNRAWLSGDGRYVVFRSNATNLVSSPPITGGAHIYRRDLTTGTTDLVTVNTTGGMPLRSGGFPAFSDDPKISGDGRYVAFVSDALDLVTTPVMSGFNQHVYLRDMNASGPGSTVLVDISTGGLQATAPIGTEFAIEPAISSDGGFVAFRSNANNVAAAPAITGGQHIFRRDIVGGTTVCIDVDTGGNESNASSSTPSISSTGQFVAWRSDATDLVAAPVATGSHIYRRDVTGGTTVMVDLDTAGGLSENITTSTNPAFANEPSISADGRFVAFSSDATDLVTDDTNAQQDIFRRDMLLTPGVDPTAVVRVSLSQQGLEVSQSSYQPRISGNGQRVVFVSNAASLVAGDTNNAQDCFMRDVGASTTQRISVGTYGEQSDLFFSSFDGVISGDGRFTAFASDAANLVDNDTNGTSDVFVRGPLQ